MKQNIGNGDKGIRVIVAMIGVYFGYVISPIFFVLSGMLLFTVVTGWCGLYRLFGIDTCPLPKKKIEK